MNTKTKAEQLVASLLEDTQQDQFEEVACALNSVDLPDDINDKLYGLLLDLYRRGSAETKARLLDAIDVLMGEYDLTLFRTAVSAFKAGEPSRSRSVESLANDPNPAGRPTKFPMSRNTQKLDMKTVCKTCTDSAVFQAVSRIVRMPSVVTVAGPAV